MPKSRIILKGQGFWDFARQGYTSALMQKERRLFPRYSVNFPVQLTVADSVGEVEFTGAAVNLSQNGIQISCDRESVSLLLNQEQYPLECRLSFRLPDSQNVIDSCCRLVANRRLAADLHHLGLTFIDFKRQSKKLLVDYLTTCQNRG